VEGGRNGFAPRAGREDEVIGLGVVKLGARHPEELARRERTPGSTSPGPPAPAYIKAAGTKTKGGWGVDSSGKRGSRPTSSPQVQAGQRLAVRREDAGRDAGRTHNESRHDEASGPAGVFQYVGIPQFQDVGKPLYAALLERDRRLDEGHHWRSAKCQQIASQAIK